MRLGVRAALVDGRFVPGDVEIEDGIEGLIHVSELSEERVELPKDVLSTGTVLKAKIIKMEPTEQKIGLSLKAVAQDLTHEELRMYQEAQERDSSITLGDALRNPESMEGEMPGSTEGDGN